MKDKVKVLLVDQIGHKTYEYDYAAAQNYSDKYDVTCYVSDNTPKDVPINGFKVEYGFHNVYSGSKISKGLKYVKSLIELRNFIKKNKFDIINLQWYDLPLADILFIKSLKKLSNPTPKVVLTVHGIIPEEKDKKKHDGLQKVYNYADAILLHSEQGVALFNDCFTTKCKKYMITSAFRDESEYQPLAKSRAREILGIPQDKTVFLSFGTIREDKTIDVFYKAFLELNKINKDAFLLSAGTLNVKNKDYYIDLANQCKETGLAKIDFDYVSKDMEPVYYSAADVLVLPYSYISQSGVAYCGLLFNLPMIGSKIDRLDIMLKDGINGEMFEKGNYCQLSSVMDGFIKDNTKIAKYVQGSIDVRTRDFSIKNRVRYTEEAYKELLGE